MKKSGFVTQEDFEAHKDKDWRTSHDIWPNIRGVVGLPGRKGSIGLAGNTGPQGPQGDVGPQGATGPVGPTGPQGAQGEVGNTGVQGPTGPGGVTGAQGEAGATGTQGPTGPGGVTGPQGEQGDQGNTGVQGATGPAGVTGAQGEIGESGPTGPTGVEGSQGPAGDQGATGVQGEQGAQGITGPQGDQGDQGNTGVQGDQGAQGATGVQGTQGVTGPQGDQGVQGATGVQGAQGVTGVQGATGAQGVTGIAGATGPQGPTGAIGEIGPGLARLTEDFDDLNTADIDGQGSYGPIAGTWSDDSTGTNTAEVVVKAGADKMLQLADGGANVAAASLDYNAGYEVVSGVFEFIVRSSDNSKNAYVSLYKDATIFIRVTFKDTGQIVFEGPDLVDHAIAAFANNTWYKIRLYFDAGAGYIIAWLDDVFDNKQTVNFANAFYANKIAVRTAVVGAVTFDFDDLKIVNLTAL